MIWLLSMLVAFSAAESPQQNRPRDPVTIGTGSIVGKVTDERTGLPISGAEVNLSGTTRPAEPKAVTDGEGQFVFSGIAAGRYQIAAKRGGYFDGAFGQRQPLGPGDSITLDDGERHTGAAISLVKPAAISGTVLDDAGEPVVKLEVRAYALDYLGGRAHYSLFGSALTDDRGIYRIGRLRAGDYLVGVPVTRPRGTADDEGHDDSAMPRDGGAVSQLPKAAGGKTQVFPGAYFPSGVAAPYATPVTVAFGDLRRNVDLQVRPAPAFKLAGTVILPAGTKRGVRVRLTTVDEARFEGGEIASMVVSDGGAFAIGAIPPGQYIVQVETPDAWASELISIADQDLTDVRLQSRPLLRVTGRIAFEGSRPEPEADALKDIAVTVERADGLPLATRPDVTLDRTGRNFTITGLPPGRYVVRLDRGLANWFLKSMTYQGRDVSLSALEIATSDITGLTATLTDTTTSITGRVTGSDDLSNTAVFVFPQDQQKWIDFGSEGRAFRAVDVRTGPFEVTDLPPGEYFAIAIIGDRAMRWREPVFLQAAARAATPVRVAEGSVTQVDLRVTAIR